MPSAQSGKACTLVSPTSPQSPKEADDATSGDVTTVDASQSQSSSQNPNQKKRGKSSSATAPPLTPLKPDSKKKGWIEIAMVDEDNDPVTGVRYAITLPDGKTVAEGTLDEKGAARVEGFDSGPCKVCFPDLDESAWECA